MRTLSTQRLYTAAHSTSVTAESWARLTGPAGEQPSAAVRPHGRGLVSSRKAGTVERAEASPRSAGSLTVLAPLSRILRFRGDAQKLGLLVYSHTFIFALEFSLKGKTAKKKKADFIYNSK